MVVRSGTRYRVRVRHQDNTGRWSHWSAPIEFTATLPDITPYLENLVITEVMYHPALPTAAEIAAGFDEDNLFEYLELRNIGSMPLDLSDLRFTKGVDFDFSDSEQPTLAPGEFILVVASIPAFEFRYGTGFQIAGEWEAGDRLSNGGERVKLSFGGGDPIRDFTYSNTTPWPVSPDGSGPSLTLSDPTSAPDHNLASNWRASNSNTGTPGVEDPENPFRAWMTSRGESDPLSPYEGTNLSNLMAFALGADLTPDDSTPSLSLIGGLPALTYRVRQGPHPVEYRVEVSNDLVTWDSGSNFTTQSGEAVDNGDGTSTITTRAIRTNNPVQFIRLRVILP
jgi:hypothetical protein